MLCRTLLPVYLSLAAVAGALSAAEPESIAPDLQVLREAKVAVDDEGLLALLRSRTLGQRDVKRVQDLIDQMGSDVFRERQEACARVVTFGPAARTLLRQATHNPDPEIQRRAQRCLRRVERQASPSVLLAAIHVVGRRNPPGTDAALLDLVPFLDDETAIEEVVHALAAVALSDGKPSDVLVRALAQPQVGKRAVAGEALCRAGGAARALGRRLLTDPDLIIRYRVAVALLEEHDRQALPVLISLLIELPRAEAGQVEEYLRQVAGEDAPEGDLDGTAKARRSYRDAWQGWWKKHEDLDLSSVQLGERKHGYLLITQLDLRNRQGRVFELDAQGKERWQIDGLSYPVYAQVLRGNRVLVCEYMSSQITERTLKGDIVWQKAVTGQPLAAQRLPSGHTFIATRSGLMEVDSAGKEVWSCRPPAPLTTARRLTDGQMVALTTTGQLVRLDRKGKVLSQFPVGPTHPVGVSIQVLPNGHILVPLFGRNRVVEFDADGNEVWSAMVRRPFCAHRLGNGHTLISSRLGLNILELGPKGQVVRMRSCDGWPLFVQQR